MATTISIERSLNGIDFLEIAEVSGNNNSYPNLGLDDGIEYYYRIRSKNSAGYSPYSNIVKATTPLSFGNATVGDAVNDIVRQNTSPPSNDAVGDTWFVSVWLRLWDGDLPDTTGNNDFIFDVFGASPSTLWRLYVGKNSITGGRQLNLSPIPNGILLNGSPVEIPYNNYDKHLVICYWELDDVDPSLWRLKIYLDGSLVYNQTIGSRSSFNSLKGGFYLNNLAGSQGSASKISRAMRVYGESLTDEDVELEWNNGNGSKHLENKINLSNATPFVEMNESSGTTASDSSGNGYDMELLNFANTGAGDFGNLLALSGISGTFQVGETITASGGKSAVVTDWASPNLRVKKHLGNFTGLIITGATSGATATVDSFTLGAWDEFDD